MFIPDPGFDFFSIPDHGSGSKAKSIFNTKNCFKARGNVMRDVHAGSGPRIQILIFYPSRIPDPGVKKAPDPGPTEAKTNLSIFNPKNRFNARGNVIPDVHAGSGSGS
jgi:hypothetical protein